MERETLIPQQADRAHRLCMRSLPVTRATAGVVQVRGTIDAQPDLRAGSREEAAPIFVQQQPVGLKAMRQLQPGRAPLRHERQRLLVPGERNDEWLSAVPCHLQPRREVRVLEHMPAGEVEGLEAHPCAGLALGEIAIGAVDVAKGSRLQHQQPQPRFCGVNAGLDERGHGRPASPVPPLCHLRHRRQVTQDCRFAQANPLDDRRRARR